ncbi:MAG: geranyl-CoA carboxylase alpha subunit, partial [Planctomycetota bacterium]
MTDFSTQNMAFRSVLVANRGEIAFRIMRSARACGLQCIAVYTHADAQAEYVEFADQAVLIGEGPAGDSYLSTERILAAARETNVQAIHPGYGFLSESADFAKAVRGAGLVFIGPPTRAIVAMGNKAQAKRLMLAAGVPCLSGYQEADQSNVAFVAAAKVIGYPVMIKAAAGGGGRGMRLVLNAASLEHDLGQARAEAKGAFGSDELILEKAVLRPRHVEIQIFADGQGNCIHLGERDCSTQRRHQKIIEESPSPAVGDALRKAMGDAAIKVAKAVDYEGAGTVEFLLDEDGQFYFLEMNTRLQVEHPVTEMVAGLDLVAMQFDQAQGQALPLVQSDVAISGHAIEVRLYAEDPTDNFLPSSGLIDLWKPGTGDGIRIDSGIRSGQMVSPYYDPMLAKIVAHGATRDQARQRLIKALRETVLFGVKSNRDFLIELLSAPAFVDGKATTALIAETFGYEGPQVHEPEFIDVATAAVMYF